MTGISRHKPKSNKADYQARDLVRERHHKHVIVVLSVMVAFFVAIGAFYAFGLYVGTQRVHSLETTIQQLDRYSETKEVEAHQAQNDRDSWLEKYQECQRGVLGDSQL